MDFFTFFQTVFTHKPFKLARVRVFLDTLTTKDFLYLLNHFSELILVDVNLHLNIPDIHLAYLFEYNTQGSNIGELGCKVRMHDCKMQVDGCMRFEAGFIGALFAVLGVQSTLRNHVMYARNSGYRW